MGSTSLLSKQNELFYFTLNLISLYNKWSEVIISNINLICGISCTVVNTFHDAMIHSHTVTDVHCRIWTRNKRLVSVFLLQNFSFITISSMPSKWCRFSYLLIGSNIPHLSTAMLRMAIAQKIFSLFLIAKHEYYHYQSHLSLLVNITIFINKQYVLIMIIINANIKSCQSRITIRSLDSLLKYSR